VNGAAPTGRDPGWRTYEVFQRQRIGQTTQLVRPRQLRSAEFVDDPYPVLSTLREHYPCYRDWPGNCFWITRYDDVTSVLADDANYTTRQRRWAYGARLPLGRDLASTVEVQRCLADTADRHVVEIARARCEALRSASADGADLVREFCAYLPIALLAALLDLPDHDAERAVRAVLALQHGASWEPTAQARGIAASAELVAVLEPHLRARASGADTDLVSVVAGLDGTVHDLIATLLELDLVTLRGSLANLWHCLLADPQALADVQATPHLLRSAWLEALRFAPPITFADRITRHEVERFGRLLPEGAVLRCSAAAALRDPRIFTEPDRFDLHRRDLAQRETRGSYRADGLAGVISIGTGPPSKHPAVPEDRPRSRFAQTRDAALAASRVVLDELSDLRLAPGAAPVIRALRLGDERMCWSLPVVFGPVATPTPTAAIAGTSS
jgi:cytochrome P450